MELDHFVKQNRENREKNQVDNNVISDRVIPRGESEIIRRAHIQCHRCMQYGHTARECNASAKPQLDRCFKCGGSGHRARGCKKKGSLNAFGPTAQEQKFLRHVDDGERSNRGRGFGARGGFAGSGRGGGEATRRQARESDSDNTPISTSGLAQKTAERYAIQLEDPSPNENNIAPLLTVEKPMLLDPTANDGVPVIHDADEDVQ